METPRRPSSLISSLNWPVHCLIIFATRIVFPVGQTESIEEQLIREGLENETRDEEGLSLVEYCTRLASTKNKSQGHQQHQRGHTNGLEYYAFAGSKLSLSFAFDVLALFPCAADGNEKQKSMCL